MPTDGCGEAFPISSDQVLLISLLACMHACHACILRVLLIRRVIDAVTSLMLVARIMICLVGYVRLDLDLRLHPCSGLQLGSCYSCAAVIYSVLYLSVL